MVKAPKEQEMREILKEALPSCGVHVAEELHEDEQMDFIISMSIGQWKALQPGGYQK